MLNPTTISTSQAARIWQIDIIVADGFVLLEVAAIVDALRIANRIAAQPPFAWSYRSAKGGMIESRCEAFVNSAPFVDRPTADYAFVIGNSDPDCPALSPPALISAYTYRGAQVFLLAEAASRYIQDRGGSAQHMSTHWENSALMRERSSLFEADSALASEDGLVVTCAGMGATVDVVLAVMGRHISSAALVTVADVLLHDRIRDFSTRQPFGGARSNTTGDADLDRCIHIMQDNIEDPLSISELVERAGISARSLERKFKTHLNTTPNRFYREMRLSKANNLLLNTSLTVAEIGLACGFSSGFSGQYKAQFGLTPMALRKRRRPGGQELTDLGTGGV
jgi:transcriptional regulator GlxA family with amidase domain